MSSAETLEPWKLHRRYAVLVDAGSSGSRVQVYSWKDPLHTRKTARPEDLQNLPKIELGDELGLHWQYKEEPGISSYASRPSLVAAHLAPLVEFALGVVPAAEVARTPFYLFATAGVRLLTEEERTALLETACAYIQTNTPFLLPSCAQHIRAISGEQEGIYGWVAVNYLMGGFEYREAWQTKRRTFGFLDMGGASTQVAFSPGRTLAEEHAHDMTPVHLRTLGGEDLTWRVFVTTFLGFGTNEARRRHVDRLLAEGHDHPPGPGGIAPGPEEEEGSHVLLDPCLHTGLTLPHTRVDPPVALRGTGAFTECQKITLPLLNKTAPCTSLPCLFNGVHAPAIDFSKHRFVGVSEYWYSSHDVLGLGGAYDADEYEAAAKTFCSRPWTEILTEQESGRYHSGLELSRLQMQCFKAAWMSNVLHEGLGIPRAPQGIASRRSGDQSPQYLANHTVPTFQSVDAIDNVQVSWTLGAALMHALYIPPPGAVEAEEGSSHYMMWGICLVLLWAAWVGWRAKGGGAGRRRRRFSFHPRKPYKMTV